MEICRLDNLPLEIKRAILTYLNPKELATFSCISRLWHVVAALDPVLSKQICFTKEYQGLDAEGLTIGDVFLHTNFDAIKKEFHCLHPCNDTIQALLTLDDTFPERKAQLLHDKAKEDIVALKAVILSQTLHALVLNHCWKQWHALLAEKLPSAPEIVPTVIANSEFQQQLFMKKWNVAQMTILYNLISRSEKSVTLLFTQRKFNILKQKFFSNACFLAQLLAQKHLSVAYLLVKDKDFMQSLSIKDVRNLEKTYPNSFSLVTNEKKAEKQSAGRFQSKLDENYYLLVTENQPELQKKEKMRERFAALATSPAIQKFLSQQGCYSFNMFLVILMIGEGTNQCKPYSSQHKNTQESLKVIWVKLSPFSIDYIESPACRELVSKNKLTLSALLQCKPQEVDRMCETPLNTTRLFPFCEISNSKILPTFLRSF